MREQDLIPKNWEQVVDLVQNAFGDGPLRTKYTRKTAVILTKGSG